MTAKVLSKSPKINETVNVEVFATEKLSHVSYTVIGRGAILKANSVQVSNKKNAVFSFKATFQMMPKAKLVVYYVREDGNMISDHLDIEFSQELINRVSIFY